VRPSGRTSFYLPNRPYLKTGQEQQVQDSDDYQYVNFYLPDDQRQYVFIQNIKHEEGDQSTTNLRSQMTQHQQQIHSNSLK